MRDRGNSCFEILKSLACGFEQSEDLLALERSRVDRPQMLLSLHFPDGRYRAFFFNGLVMNVFGFGGCFFNNCRRFFNCWRFFRLVFYRLGGLYCFFWHQVSMFSLGGSKNQNFSEQRFSHIIPHLVEQQSCPLRNDTEIVLRLFVVRVMKTVTRGDRKKVLKQDRRIPDIPYQASLSRRKCVKCRLNATSYLSGFI